MATQTVVNPLSWLTFARLFKKEGVVFWELPEVPNIKADGTDRIHTIKTNDRIDRLAAEPPLGDPQLWWAIAALNGMRLIPRDFEEDLEIRIPTRQRLRQEGLIKF